MQQFLAPPKPRYALLPLTRLPTAGTSHVLSTAIIYRRKSNNDDDEGEMDEEDEVGDEEEEEEKDESQEGEGGGGGEVKTRKPGCSLSKRRTHGRKFKRASVRTKCLTITDAVHDQRTLLHKKEFRVAKETLYTSERNRENEKFSRPAAMSRTYLLVPPGPPEPPEPSELSEGKPSAEAPLGGKPSRPCAMGTPSLCVPVAGSSFSPAMTAATGLPWTKPSTLQSQPLQNATLSVVTECNLLCANLKRRLSDLALPGKACSFPPAKLLAADCSMQATRIASMLSKLSDDLKVLQNFEEHSCPAPRKPQNQSRPQPQPQCCSLSPCSQPLSSSPPPSLRPQSQSQPQTQSPQQATAPPPSQKKRRRGRPPLDPNVVGGISLSQINANK